MNTKLEHKQAKTSARFARNAPFCELADLLLEREGAADAISMEWGDGDDDGMHDEQEEGRGKRKHQFGAVMMCLKTLALPDVAVGTRGLPCQGGWDDAR